LKKLHKWGLTPFFFSATMALAGAPSAVSTFHSIGLYWSPEGGAESNPATVRFREPGGEWRQGLDLWFDARNNEYRGSLVELKPGVGYEIQLKLKDGKAETLSAKTWSEKFPVKRIVEVPAGTKRLVIRAEDSGDENGYVVFTGKAIEGDDTGDACVLVKQGAHHVIIRGFTIRNCKRYGVLVERQFDPVLDAQTRDIVIEDNDISGWGAFDSGGKSNLADTDGAIQCSYRRETDDAKRPDRIVVQRNRIHDPRHGTNPWQSRALGRKNPSGPQAVNFDQCGTNHVLRYNEVFSKNGHHFKDGIGGGENFSSKGFPWADSDIYGNRISEAYDDGVEAEGGNRNVRIWGNYFDRVFTAIANAATATGPLYVWRNVSNRMGGMYEPDGSPDRELRGPFIKAGSNHGNANGGRAYYFHNTALQPQGGRYAMGAGWGISKNGGRLYNFVSRNNIWQVHKEPLINGEPKFLPLRAETRDGPFDADYDLYNGELGGLRGHAERHGWKGRPSYASTREGDFSLKAGSLGHGTAARIPNFNDQYPRPDVGAHQSGTPPMRFGADWSGRTPAVAQGLNSPREE
jgi:hypothetical protein